MSNLLLSAIMPHPPIIIPEIGREETKKIYKTISAMDYLSKKIVNLSPDVIILVTPHSVFDSCNFNIYSGKKLDGDFERFGCNELSFSFNNDIEFVTKLKQSVKNLKLIPEHYLLDHGSLVPLYFLKNAGYKGNVVIINYSALGISEHIKFGQTIKNIMENSDKKYVFIASGDLSHRLTPSAPAGYSPKGVKFDNFIIESIQKGDYNQIINMSQYLREDAGECAFNSLMIAFGVVDNDSIPKEPLSYEGPFGVGYLVSEL